MQINLLKDVKYKEIRKGNTIYCRTNYIYVSLVITYIGIYTE